MPQKIFAKRGIKSGCPLDGSAVRDEEWEFCAAPVQKQDQDQLSAVSDGRNRENGSLAKILFVMLALAFTVVCPGMARAQDTWGGANDNWNVPANWLGNAVPGSGTDAIIDSGSATLSDSASGTSDNLTVGDSGAGALTVTGGNLTTTGGVIGNNAGSNGSVLVTNGTWGDSGNLYVGNSGTGTLNISGENNLTYLTGGTVSDVNAVIGNGVGSNGTATLSSDTTNAVWINSGSLTVGNYGNGTLSLSSEIVLSVGSGTGTIVLASEAGSTGTLNIGTGFGSFSPYSSAPYDGPIEAAAISGGSGTAKVVFKSWRWPRLSNDGAAYRFAVGVCNRIFDLCGTPRGE
jgi:T5SS/PEP-CTERM-associated repeat protein